MSEIWVWSDVHIGHVNLCEKWRPTYGGSVPAHTETVRERWNDIVTPNDEIWIIGDAVMGKREENLAIIGSFHGIKHLVPGNHDDVHAMTKPTRRERMMPIYEQYFTVWPEAISGAVWDLPEIAITHFPWSGTPDHEGSERDHYDRWMPVRERYPFDTVLVHGHTHSSAKISDHAIHVGVDAWTDGPVSVATIESLIPHARVWI